MQGSHALSLVGRVVASLLAAVLCLAPAPSQTAEAPRAGAARVEIYDHLLEMQPDPLEPWNRSVARLNDRIALHLLRPVSRVWRLVVRKPLRVGFRNVHANLGYPGRLVNNLLQGKLRGAWVETERFGINTTLGLAGLRDVARGFGLHASREDLGQTLAFWGWDRSAYFVLPLLGPSTLRDTLGTAGDFALDPLSYVLPTIPAIVTNGGLVLNDTADSIEGYARFLSREYDPYQLTLHLWSLDRLRDLVDQTPRGERSAATETLGVLFLAPGDPEFEYLSETHRVALGPGRHATYTAWIQPEPAALVMILSGLGTHRLDDTSLALAEMAWRNGYSAVTLSDVMNFEFIAQTSSTALPGDPLTDAADVREALGAIEADVEQRHPGIVTRRALMGLSLGGFHTLLIAAADAQGRGRGISFDRYLAINPPVRLTWGMRQIDRYYDARNEWPPQDRFANVQRTLLTAIELAADNLEPHGVPPFSDVEARFLIGLNFHLALRDVIFQAQHGRNQGLLHSRLREFRRRPAYREISRFSFTDYYNEFVEPYYAARPGHSRDQLERDSSLESFGTALVHARDKTYVFTNRNDFLLAPRDLRWLKQTFGARNLELAPGGGHLGNLYKPDVQDRILQLLGDDAAEPISALGAPPER